MAGDQEYVTWLLGISETRIVQYVFSFSFQPKILVSASLAFIFIPLKVTVKRHIAML